MTTAGRPRLLLDQNLAASLVARLEDIYPNSVHVRQVGLAAADDERIWQYASDEGLIITTKDDDFRQRSMLRGAPPHVIWLRLGNCRTADVEAVLRARVADVQALVRDPLAALLILAHT